MSATEIFELRRRNLTQLIDDWIASQQFKTGKEICEHYGLDSTYIAQLLNSKRQIGKQVARELEQQLQLPSQWLDQISPDMPNRVIQVQGRGLACYAMQCIQQQLFKLEAVGDAEILLAQLPQDFKGYLLQISNISYQPVLKPNWYLVLQQGLVAEHADLVCVQLQSHLSLLLYYDQQVKDKMGFYALDGQRQVQFHHEDILAIDVVQAIVAPKQVRLRSKPQ